MKKDLNLDFEQLEGKNYGFILDTLRENELNFELSDSKAKSNFELLKAILWELLGNFPKAKEGYEKTLELNVDNLIALQYKAQLFSILGDYDTANSLFAHLFNRIKEPENPFSLNRSIMGYRDRTIDINYLNKYIPKKEEYLQKKCETMGFTCFSMLDVKRALEFFETLKEKSPIVKIMTIVGKMILNLSFNANEIPTIKLANDNQYFLKINELFELLVTAKHSIYRNALNYNPEISKALQKLLTNVEGWLDLCEANVLFQISKSFNFQNSNGIIVVEIGSYQGRSSISITQGLKERGEGCLYAIDPHLGIPYYHPESTLNCFTRNIEEAGVKEFVRIEIGTSKEWSSKINLPISLLFIDADHTYEMVKMDFDLWEPKIIPGGIIAFHDAVQDGPFHLINEIIESKKFQFLNIVGNIAILQKYKSISNIFDCRTLCNSILINIYRFFYLEFVENNERAMRNQVFELINKFFKNRASYY